MKATRLGIGALAAAGFLLAVSGAATADTRQALSAESVLETIKKRGELRVGLSTFVPWAMRDKNGELIGFEIDVAKQLAEDMEGRRRLRADGVGRESFPPCSPASSTRSSAACRLRRSET